MRLWAIATAALFGSLATWFVAGAVVAARDCRAPRRGAVRTISTPVLSLQSGVWMAERRVVDEGRAP